MSLFLNLLFETDSYSNEYLLATFGFDTEENEACKVCPLSAYRSPRCGTLPRRERPDRQQAAPGRARGAEDAGDHEHARVPGAEAARGPVAAAAWL